MFVSLTGRAVFIDAWRGDLHVRVVFVLLQFQKTKHVTNNMLNKCCISDLSKRISKGNRGRVAEIKMDRLGSWG